MGRWFWIIWATVLIVLSGVQFSEASRRATFRQPAYGAGYLTRQQIHQTPLLERPNRPGHVYGNTVRRIHDRRTARGL